MSSDQIKLGKGSTALYITYFWETILGSNLLYASKSLAKLSLISLKNLNYLGESEKNVVEIAYMLSRGLLWKHRGQNCCLGSEDFKEIILELCLKRMSRSSLGRHEHHAEETAYTLQIHWHEISMFRQQQAVHWSGHRVLWWMDLLSNPLSWKLHFPESLSCSKLELTQKRNLCKIWWQKWTS